MAEVGVHEAKTHLSRLLRRVALGEEIVITRSGEPIAVLAPVARPGARQIGVDDGLLEIAEDFDAPLPPEILGSFSR